MSAPRLLFCLGTAKGLSALEVLARREDPSVHQVCTFRETHTEGDSDEAIIARAKELGITAHRWVDMRDSLADLIAREHINGIIAIGWRYLIPTEITATLPHGLIVFHDSLLPRHRGFAPLATAILCGDQEAGVTALLGSDRVDAGDIIAQRRMILHDKDTIADAIARSIPLYEELVELVLDTLENGKRLPAVAQDDGDATYSIWRNPEDAEINWHRSAVEIDRLVRASGSPYPGAFTFLQGRKVRVRRVELMQDVPFSIREPGKVWLLQDGAPVVVCGEGLLWIVDATWDHDGSAHLPLWSLRVRYGMRP